MAITTYTELQTAIANWLNRPDAETALRIPEFISLLEDTLGIDDAIREERRDTLTIQQQITTLPADLRELISLSINTGTVFGPIEIVAPEQIDTLNATYLTASFPRFGAIMTNGTELKVIPTPDQAYVANIEYWRTLDRLSGTTASNWILASHANVYLFGSLVEAEPYLKNDDRFPLWQSRFDKALSDLKLFIQRRKWSPNTLVIRPNPRRVIGAKM